MSVIRPEVQAAIDKVRRDHREALDRLARVAVWHWYCTACRIYGETTAPDRAVCDRCGEMGPLDLWRAPDEEFPYQHGQRDGYSFQCWADGALDMSCTNRNVDTAGLCPAHHGEILGDPAWA